MVSFEFKGASQFTSHDKFSESFKSTLLTSNKKENMRNFRTDEPRIVKFKKALDNSKNY